MYHMFANWKPPLRPPLWIRQKSGSRALLAIAKQKKISVLQL